MRKNKLLLLLALLLTAATGAWATDVYVVGNGSDGNWLNGVAWDPGVADNKMTEQNGVYSITFNDVDANSELLFKFAINGTWDVNYGCTSWDANELNKTLSNIEAGGANFKFGLTEKADVTISFNLSEMTYMISTKGMKVGDDAATGYTVSMKDGVKDADKWTVKVGEGQAQALPIGGLTGDGSETVTLQYNGRLKVKGVKATSDAAEVTPALSITSPSVGQVIGSDGKNYAYGSLPTGVTAVAKICYVSGSNGLALALTDEEGTMEWRPAIETIAAHTAPFTGGTWKVASKDEWSNMITAAGSYSALRDGFSSVGGTNMQSGYYWTSTEWDSNGAWSYNFSDGYWASDPMDFESYVRACLAFTVEQAAKPAATVTTAPTGAAVVGVGKTTALVSGGVADGGTLWYAVTTTNTKPASTDGFSDAVPTAKDITASGKVYVWYHVKGDDTHSDSEIAATAIEVPVADVVWDATNVSDLEVPGDAESYTKEGIKLSCNAEDVNAVWYEDEDPTMNGISLRVQASGGFTFTAPTGKKFTKIEMNAVYSNGWDGANLGTGWKFVEDAPNNIYKATWTGSASSTVDLLKDVDDFGGEPVKSIAFYLSE